MQSFLNVKQWHRFKKVNNVHLFKFMTYNHFTTVKIVINPLNKGSMKNSCNSCDSCRQIKKGVKSD